MGNIRDYIRWRGDLSFEQSPFNEVDNLILSCFAYINLDGMEEAQGEWGILLPKLAERFFHTHRREELEADKSFVAQAVWMMEEMAASRRFGAMVVRNYVNEIIVEAEQQFCAMELLLEDGSTYVAFRGTDDTIVGWKEDFRLSNRVVPAQRKAARYLDRIGEKGDSARPLRVGGHSKGGNLAIYGAARCGSRARRQIVEVYSNDGPGFPKAFWQQEKTRDLLPRIRRMIPEASMIGMLLEQEKEPIIVKSSQRWLLQHDGFSWEVLGKSFVRAEQLNKKAAAFNEILHKWVDQMNEEQRDLLIEDLFAVLEASGAENISQIQEGGAKSLGAVLKRIEKFPAESRAMLLELTGGLLLGLREQLHLETQDRISALQLRKQELPEKKQ